MNVGSIVALGGLVLFLAFLIARVQLKKGLNFWRALVMAVIGLTGLAMILLKMFFSIAE